MKKNLTLALHKYPVVPHSLRADPRVNAAAPTIDVNLANLYHHYYLDSFAKRPPNPDPCQFEHIHFLLSTTEFRFQGNGLGIAPGIKKNRSYELGQAFCRWFLHDHLNITYFAHMEHVLGRQLHRAFNECRIERATKGDTPDYFCAKNVSQVFLAEAKGRYTSISFKNKEFGTWRDQFNRVVFMDASDKMRSIKGHIVATRFSTERDSQTVKSGIYAEDPASPGERPIEPDVANELGTFVISSHYSGIANKLGQPLLASALANGIPLPDELLIRVVVWRLNFGPLSGQRFIGGYFGAEARELLRRDDKGNFFFDSFDPLRLDSPHATFFGVEESIFRQVVQLARTSNAAQLRRFELLAPFYSGFSILRDGSVLGPVDFFSPEEQITL